MSISSDWLAQTRQRWESSEFPLAAHLILDGFDGSTDEFFRDGEASVSAALKRAHDFQRPERYERALDFGCGIGRLTRPLAEVFDYVMGVDISPTMIEQARAYDDRPDYRVSGSELPTVEPVDFLLSIITLQHIPEDKAKRLLGHFPALLTEGGIGCVQMSHPSNEGGMNDATAREVLGERLLGTDMEVPYPGCTSTTYWFRP